MLIVLLLLTVLAVLAIAVGLADENSNWWVPGIFALILIGCLGWGMIGNLASVKTEKVLANSPCIVKTKTAAIVEYKGLRKIYEDVETYNAITDSSKFDYVTHYNMYGGVTFHELYLSPTAEE